ncbi:reverse transcriptase domain-containing protein [Tanacetum coccineum]|uniref:Reverse transcriptase domain-containing protein n=1 Tax=Tanacetum coccineum TaxID=301880 RepID=A0ABQ4WMI7_9ASTR
MSTQSFSNQIELHFSIPEKSLQFRQVEESGSDNLFHDHIQGEDENDEDVQMTDHLRPMEELLRIPIVGIENAIVVPAILADEFELKTELLDFLILFPFSLKGAAETWLENEPPNSITSWDDLVSKFLNQFFPHSKTRELKKEITNFQQVFGETFTKAWERFKDLLKKCPRHGFSPLHQIDFFYNGLSQSDQDFLNTAAGGNLMSKNTQEALTIMENRSKVRTCRNKPQVSSGGGSSIQNDAITALTKQVEDLVHHISSMQEAYNQNQEAPIQLMQTQMGQLEEAFQERPSCVLSSNTDPRAELNVITSMDGLTLDGSFIPYSNLLVYQEKEQEPETITEVVGIASSKSTPLVPPSETPPLIDIVDSLCEKIPIENNSLSGNPTSFDLVVEYLSSLPTPFGDSNSLLEETDTLLSHFDDSLPEYKTFSFDIEEKSSGSTTTRSDYSLPDYDAFYFDDNHFEEKSSGSTTTHFDFSLPEYASFHFDLLIDPLPPADRSDSHHEEFVDELTHITSTVEFSEIELLVSFPSGNEEIIFDLRIFIIKRVQSQRLYILPLDDFYSISFVSAPLFLTHPLEIETFLSFPARNEDKVFDPGIFFINGVSLL